MVGWGKGERRIDMCFKITNEGEMKIFLENMRASEDTTRYGSLFF